jgi:hypothetical protein
MDRNGGGADLGAIAELRERAQLGAVASETLDTGDLWGNAAVGPLLWRAKSLRDPPCFYPVFRWGDLHSWSFLALLVQKGRLDVNRSVAFDAERKDFVYHAGADTIDREIDRVGGPHLAAPDEFLDAEAYARAIADGLRGDVAACELRHPGYTNVVLVGGKDSQNLLLLPWRNPVIAVSAQPNFPLVQEFARRNDLRIPVRELTDPSDAEVHDREILENACRANLIHFRWGADLRRIAFDHGGKLIFWKGQVADALTTPYWKTLTHPIRGAENLARKLYARADHLFPHALQTALTERVIVPRLRRTLWRRCAMFQGTHMGVIRAITGALVLSAYHGPRVSHAWQRVRWVDAVQRDLRVRIGELLHGAPVHYPTTNPGPPLSSQRAGHTQPARFFEALRRDGIEVSGV